MTQTEFKHSVLPLKNKLFCYAYSILKNKEDAKDAVQDTMLKIWAQQKELSEYNNIESWCMTLIRNRSLDFFKSKARHHVNTDDQRNLYDMHVVPDQELEQKDLLKKVKEIIANLPLLQQEIIHLRDFQGKSYKEMAKILKSDMNNIKVNLHRARKTIREKTNKMNAYGLQST